MAKVEKMIATVLAFEKKLVPSDGYLYGTTWEKRYQTTTPLKLIEKSVRGTISNRLKDAIKNDPLKLNAEVEKPNLQKVDACALGEHHDTLKLHFTLKVLGGVEKPSACNNEAFNQAYATAANSYVEHEGFTELAKRYAINLANGRYLWRNRVGAEKVEVVITAGSDTWTFNAHDFSLKNFDSSHANVLALASKIADALSGKIPYLLLNIEAYALVGSAQEVYPSEELVLDKGKGDKSKILYSVNDVAAMHSQKIGNALRTIDTWYP
ncbi:type I-F CRISPR-associated protein Csy3, partial [uncultured Agitococcus sp.]|uniref:type I-F CRISPR-associated protein Csy3 n=1 Tax=uncultured Agitococcus sp. TaxID=1506599 RepID=UPI002619A90C